MIKHTIKSHGIKSMFQYIISIVFSKRKTKTTKSKSHHEKHKQYNKP